jgi:hypothetical protein
LASTEELFRLYEQAGDLIFGLETVHHVHADDVAQTFMRTAQLLSAVWVDRSGARIREPVDQEGDR